ncbi:hypothetical protein QWS52_004836, partial [Escherichia coli]|nr:hypothetical protein [Escherichia coli]
GTGIDLRGTNTLTATNGSINLTGSSTNGTGTSLAGNSSWDATSITITGSSSHDAPNIDDATVAGKGVHLYGDLTFTGNVAINGTAMTGAGVGLAAKVNLTFNNGTAVINGTNNGFTHDDPVYSAGIADIIWIGDDSTKNITLMNSDLTIDGHSQNAPGIGGWHESGAETKWNIFGYGNVTINASSVECDGLKNVSINASGLNGTTTLHGTSTNGSGVNLHGMTMTNVTISGSATGKGSGVGISGNSTLNNTTVSGNGTDGAGVSISGTLSNSGNSTVTGNASGNGNGVNISGNITDGVISGSATGNGAGVDISG